MISIRSDLLCSLLIFSAVTAAGPVAAQGVCSEPTNLTTNCDFIKAISGWNQILGQDFLSARDGHDGGGSLQATSEFNINEELEFAQCAEMATPLYGAYGAGAWVKVINGEVLACTLIVNSYTNATCSGYPSEFFTSFRTDFGSTWVLVSGAFVVSSGINSFRTAIHCQSGSGPFTARFDDYYLGLGIDPPFFEDGFEAGNTSAWSTTVP